MIIFFIFLIVAIISITKTAFKATRLTGEHIIPFTGGVGAGKTFLAVRALRSRYRRLMLKYRLRKIPILKKWSTDTAPTVWSSIPVRFYHHRKPVYSNVMTSEHWLMIKKLPENCLVLGDEFGQVASQYDFDNPNVQVNLQTLVRFIRHFTNGYLYLTDQSAENIAVQVRRRFNVVYNVSNFRRARLFGLIPLPFYKVDVNKMMVADENSNNVNVVHNELNDGGQDYFFGYLPYFKKSKNIYYETRCYRYAYDYGFVPERPPVWANLYTRFLADLSCSESERKQFKTHRNALLSGDSSPVPDFPEAEPTGKKARKRYKRERDKYRSDKYYFDINEL